MQELDAILEREYSLVQILRSTDKMRIRHLRHKTLERDIVQLSFTGDGAIYRLLQGIQQENLPRIYEVSERDSCCTVLEEFIDGITVAEVLKSGLYNEEGVRRVMLALCDAVYVLHGMGIIHRDIKPENVMITSAGRVVLLDFDTARRHDPEKSRDTQVMGTAGYAAPEQFGISQTDGRADIFALGILMNVMLTGCHPAKRTAKGVFGKIIEKCTRLDPERRYADIVSLKRTLEKMH